MGSLREGSFGKADGWGACDDSVEVWGNGNSLSASFSLLSLLSMLSKYLKSMGVPVPAMRSIENFGDSRWERGKRPKSKKPEKPSLCGKGA